MGGTIGLESELGRGSRFYVDLTLPRQTGVDDSPETASPVLMSGMRVLVVDDNATNRRVLREQLTSWGCEPSEVASARDALQELSDAYEQEAPFRVAIIDMQMPEIDGDELGRLIREDSHFDDMPMILYTSIGEHGSAEQMRDRGFAVVLTKPARQSQLFSAMLSILGDRETVAPNASSVFDDKRESLGLNVLLAEDNEINQMVAKDDVGAVRVRCHNRGDGQSSPRSTGSVSIRSGADGCPHARNGWIHGDIEDSRAGERIGSPHADYRDDCESYARRQRIVPCFRHG